MINDFELCRIGMNTSDKGGLFQAGRLGWKQKKIVHKRTGAGRNIPLSHAPAFQGAGFKPPRLAAILFLARKHL